MLDIGEGAPQHLGRRGFRKSGREHPQHIVPDPKLDCLGNGRDRNERKHVRLGRKSSRVRRNRPVDLGGGSPFQQGLRHAGIGVRGLPDFMPHSDHFVIPRTLLGQTELGRQFSRLLDRNQMVLRPVDDPQGNLPQWLDIRPHISTRDGNHHLPAGGLAGSHSCGPEASHRPSGQGAMVGIDRCGSFDLIENGESPLSRTRFHRPAREDRVIPGLALGKHDDTGIEFGGVSQDRPETGIGRCETVRSSLPSSM